MNFTTHHHTATVAGQPQELRLPASLDKDRYGRYTGFMTAVAEEGRGDFRLLSENFTAPVDPEDELALRRAVADLGWRWIERKTATSLHIAPPEDAVIYIDY